MSFNDSLTLSLAGHVKAMSPVLPEDSVLLTLPFGGAVLQKLGVPKVEIDSILVILLFSSQTSAENASIIDGFLGDFSEVVHGRQSL